MLPAVRSRRRITVSRVALLLAGLPGASALSAQDAPTFTMRYVVANDTLGVERVTVNAASWTGDLRMRGQPRLRWTQSLDTAGGVSTLAIDAWRPGAADGDSPMQRLTLRTRGDSAYVYATPVSGAPLGAPVATLAARRGARWLVNQSLAHAAWLAHQTARAGQDTAWVMLASGAQLVPGVLRRSGDTLALTIAGMETRLQLAADGTPRSVHLPAQRVTGIVVAGAAGAAGAAPAPLAVSYEAPAGAPYVAEQLRIATPMGHQLGATLTRPNSAGRVPLVITISGSGAQERDEAIPGVEGYRPFREFADTLARRGVAVLRFDDRGTGESGGTHRGATSRDFADDVRALVSWARTRDDLDPRRILLLGHSEGGLIAPLVAADDSMLAGIALLAGPAYTGARIVAFQQRAAIQERYPSAYAAVRDSLFRASQQELDGLARADVWLREFLTYDPLPTLARVRVPVLILQGNTDMQVTPEQADTLAAALQRGGNPRVTMRRLPATNHLFQRDPSGLPGGYGTLPDRRVTREALGLVVDWVLARVAP
jgi:alpha-beta hydrolase superfamily lysophospholipase